MLAKPRLDACELPKIVQCVRLWPRPCPHFSADALTYASPHAGTELQRLEQFVCGLGQGWAVLGESQMDERQLQEVLPGVWRNEHRRGESDVGRRALPGAPWFRIWALADVAHRPAPQRRLYDGCRCPALGPRRPVRLGSHGRDRWQRGAPVRQRPAMEPSEFFGRGAQEQPRSHSRNERLAIYSDERPPELPLDAVLVLRPVVRVVQSEP
mmetsp:Transcript_3670/g.9371  ORF Transcript_3670/g.9371 Transcript_3670/m.9371 type:complete len:211 (-) Transcript_3670:997-1629(-)